MSPQVIDTQSVLAVLREQKPAFAERYGVSRIGVFGSVARGDARADSDIDVVVEMTKPDLFAMVHVKEALEVLFSRAVDVVRFREKMNPYLRARIEREARYA
jgi:predicted nucleotidyltransferase